MGFKRGTKFQRQKCPYGCGFTFVYSGYLALHLMLDHAYEGLDAVLESREYSVIFQDQNVQGAKA